MPGPSDDQRDAKNRQGAANVLLPMLGSESGRGAERSMGEALHEMTFAGLDPSEVLDPDQPMTSLADAMARRGRC